MRAREFDYEFRHISFNGKKFVVNLSKHECSCRRWMLTGLPCCHAISCMKDQQLEVDDFVPDYHKNECYKACYTPMVYIVNEESLWIKKTLLIYNHHP